MIKGTYGGIGLCNEIFLNEESKQCNFGEEKQMKVEFRDLENTSGMFGRDQVGVYVDGELMFYLTDAGFANYPCDWRVFAVPEDYQLSSQLNEIVGNVVGASNISKMKQNISNNIEKLVRLKTELTPLYSVSALLKSGIIQSIDKEAYSYGYLRFNMSVGFGCVNMRQPELDKLMLKLKKDKDMEDVVEVYTINLYTGERNVIYRG